MSKTIYKNNGLTFLTQFEGSLEDNTHFNAIKEASENRFKVAGHVWQNIKKA